MNETNKKDSNNLVHIIRDASSKGFKNKEIDVIKTVYDMAMSEYVAHNPYSVYKDSSLTDTVYFDNQRTYAAAKAREYVIRTIDSWQVKK